MMATDGETGRGYDKQKVYIVTYGRNVLNAKILEVSLLVAGTVFRLERDAWSMVKCLRQATNEHTHTPFLQPIPPPSPSTLAHAATHSRCGRKCER